MTTNTDGLVVRKDVKTTLTEARKDELAREIAAHTIRYDELEQAKKDATRDITAKMRAERADWTRKAKAIRTGTLDETVECTEHHDFDRNEVFFLRIDSGEKVSSRAMTGGERQTSLDLGEEPAPVVNVDKGKPRRRLRAVPDAAPEGEGVDPEAAH